MDVGDRSQLQCILENPPEGVYAEWSSNNPSVAVVDPTGSIVAIAPGDAEIVVRAGDIRVSVMVQVNDYKASKLTITVSGLKGEQNAQGRMVYKIKVGDVCQLTPNIDPKGAKVEHIDWSSSDPETAELSDDDELIAAKKGEVFVTASSGALSDTIVFQIEENGIPVATLIRYIIIIVISIVIIVVVVILAAGASRRRKEEEARRAAAARQRKEEARQRAEEAEKRVTDAAEVAALIEKNKQVLDMEASAHKPPKVSGATVSATTDKANPHDEKTERPLTLDDVE
jgi:ABC-type Fe3+-hydroxamate transport system substrate-binding protein